MEPKKNPISWLKAMCQDDAPNVADELSDEVLAEIGFDPLRHLKKDASGLWQLHDDGSESFVQLRDKMRMIARDRNEDSTDTDTRPAAQGH